VNASFDEPTIPPRMRRPLAAVWISLGLHVAVIALVQVAPPATTNLVAPVIEARLVTVPAASPAIETPARPLAAEPPDIPPEAVPLLAPSRAAEALPVVEPAATPPAEPAPPAAVSQPVAGVPTPSPRAPAAPPVTPDPVPAVTITPSVDLTYYRARDVDVPPRALREIEPDYPVDADKQQLSGRVILQLKLEADGRVSDVEVISAAPPGLFEDSAVKAFREARFSPAQKSGHPVRALVLVEVVYDWEGRAR
jgi:protein TonB